MQDGATPSSDDASDASSDGLANGADVVVPGPPASVKVAAIATSCTISTVVQSDGGLLSPSGLVLVNDDTLYIADTGNNAIRVVSLPEGGITTLAGGAEGGADGLSPSFGTILGMTLGGPGTLLVADKGNNSIRRVVFPGGNTSSIANGFKMPTDVAVDRTNRLLVTETTDIAVSTISDGGVGVVSALASPDGGYLNLIAIAVDENNNVYVTDEGNGRIVETLADGGKANVVYTDVNVEKGLAGIAVDPSGNVYYVQSAVSQISMLSPTNPHDAGLVAAGGTGSPFSTDGPCVGGNANFVEPYALVLDSTSNMYFTDQNFSTVRKIAAPGYGQLAVSWKAGAGSSSSTTYTATASNSTYPSQSCIVTGTLGCTISRLVSGVPYDVAVTATNGGDASAPVSANGAVAPY